MNDLIYHGSENIIKQPVYGKGSLSNDYGRGFYCTENIELAKEWACKNNTDGYANTYSINYENLKILNLNSPEYSVLNWLAILAENRTYWQKHSIAQEAKKYLKENFLIDIKPYDIIIGYRADDSYFSFAQDFVSGSISFRKLTEAMSLGKLGEQIVLKSKKSFKHISYAGYEKAESNIYYSKKNERDKSARRAYRNTRSSNDSINDLFMIDIMRMNIISGDERLKTQV